VDRLDNGVRLSGQEAKYIDINRAFLLLPDTFPCRPNASEGKERLFLIESELM